MKKLIWLFDLMLLITLFFLTNYTVTSISINAHGIIIGQIINLIAMAIILLFGLYRLTRFKRTNYSVFFNLLKGRITIKKVFLIFIIFIICKLSYSALYSFEFVKAFDLNILEPVLVGTKMFNDMKPTIIIIYVLLVLIGVFAEELFFRGYLYNIQYKYYGKYAWVINGVSWSLIHIFAKANVIALLPTAFLISWIYKREKNLWIVYGVHLLINITAVYPVIASYY